MLALVGALAAEGADEGNFGDVAEDLKQLASAAEAVLVEFLEQFGRFVAVELDAKTAFGTVKIGFADRPEDVIERGIDEDAKHLDLVGGVILAQALDDFGSSLGRHEAGASGVEVEANGARAGFGGEQGVVRPRDAADFDLVHAGAL